MFGRKSREPSRIHPEEASTRPHEESTISFIVGDSGDTHSVITKLEENQNEEGNASLLSLAIRADLPIEHSCGGYGTCGTCRVFIEAGLELLEHRGEIETEMAFDRNFADNERLACQTNVQMIQRQIPTDGLYLQIRIPPIKFAE